MFSHRRQYPKKPYLFTTSLWTQLQSWNAMIYQHSCSSGNSIDLTARVARIREKCHRFTTRVTIPTTINYQPLKIADPNPDTKVFWNPSNLTQSSSPDHKEQSKQNSSLHTAQWLWALVLLYTYPDKKAKPRWWWAPQPWRWKPADHRDLTRFILTFSVSCVFGP